MKALPIIYNYEQNDNSYNISFLFENNHHLVNATEMAKPFGKNVSRFLDDPDRREAVYLYCERNSLKYSEIEPTASLSISELAKLFPESIRVVKGGLKQQGTWFHEDIAIEFARWLSPKFAIWCNDKLKELFKNGVVYLKTTQQNSHPDYLLHSVQKEKSKAVATKNYGKNKNTGKVIYYFRDVFEKVVGVTPSSMKAWARKTNIPLTVINKGGREIVRLVFPEKACVFSLIDDLYASDPSVTIENIDKLVKLGKKFEPMFLELTEMGYGDPDDLKYLEHNKLLMLKRNNSL